MSASLTSLLGACECPQPVKSRLRTLVRVELEKVRALKDLSTFFTKALDNIALAALGVLDKANATIPSPTAIDLNDISDFVKCPLLALAVSVEEDDFTDMDPQVQLNLLKDMQRDEIARARKAYEDVLSGSPQAGQINLLRRYTEDMERLKFDPESFANAVLVTATVFVLCQDEYQSGPYEDFVQEIEGFSLTGGLPSGLGPNFAQVAGKFQIANAKFAALNQVTT